MDDGSSLEGWPRPVVRGLFFVGFQTLRVRSESSVPGDAYGRLEETSVVVASWGALDAWRPVGGVRIEDNVLITADGPRVMTAEIPK